MSNENLRERKLGFVVGVMMKDWDDATIEERKKIIFAKVFWGLLNVFGVGMFGNEFLELLYQFLIAFL